VLEALERVHQPDAARRAYRGARAAGFRSVNLDLIYGAHGETSASWRRTVEEAAALGPEHLSCYALTIEPATPLGRKVAAGVVPGPDPDLQAEMYDMACRVLASAGYRHYEVSNWALPGHECVHNLGYWEGHPYLGLGAGAHSHRDIHRWWNVRPPGTYVELVAGGVVPVGGRERLGIEEVRLERLLLGLRRTEGVPVTWVPAEVRSVFLDRGLARLGEGRFALTEPGMLLANEAVVGAG
jgi:coproporphyrinogen III oxidase-like Fe-S oxidoreductase